MHKALAYHSSVPTMDCTKRNIVNRELSLGVHVGTSIQKSMKSPLSKHAYRVSPCMHVGPGPNENAALSLLWSSPSPLLRSLGLRCCSRKLHFKGQWHETHYSACMKVIFSLSWKTFMFQ